MNLKKNNKILTLMVLLLIFVFSNDVSTAQSNRGLVLEKRLSKPMAGVNVYLKNIGIGTTTDEKGEFNLNYFSAISENDTLYFSSIGYVTQKITFSELKENDYVVLLSEEVQLLNEVTITSGKHLKSQIAYNTLTSLKDGLYSFGSLLIEDKIWVIGGDESYEEKNALKAFRDYGVNFLKHIKSDYSWQNFSGSLSIYDMQTDRWTTFRSKFSKRAYHNIHYFNGKIYILGGKRLSADRRTEYLDDKIEVYDINQNAVLVDNTNPHQAVNFSSFVYDGNLVVMGGSTKLKMNGEKEYSSKVHLLNLKSGYWYELDDMPIAKETKGILINSTIYLIGGFNLNPLKEIETYNLTTAEWKTEGQLFYEVERPALAYNENIIYIFEDGKIQTYNIETKELNMYSIDLPLKNSELFYANNTLYLLGGFQQDEFSISPSLNLYSIDINEFKKTKIYNTKKL